MDPSPRMRRPLPSPASALALVALFAALAGTSLALPGRNTVDSGDIANGEVGAKDIAKNAVKGKHVKESSLAPVPDADAVGGQRVRAFQIEMPDDAPTESFSQGGVRLDADCDGGAPTLFAAKVRDLPAVYHSFGMEQDPGPLEVYGKDEGSFVAGDTEPLSNPGSNAGQVTVHVLFDDGRSTQIDGAYRNVPPGGGSGCSFWGRVMSD